MEIPGGKRHLNMNIDVQVICILVKQLSQVYIHVNFDDVAM